MSTVPHQDQTAREQVLREQNSRFVTLRAGGQTFAMAASAVLGTRDIGAVGPVTDASPEGATGTLLYEGKDIPVFRLADWMGIKERRDGGSVQTLVVQATLGRLALQAREVSAAFTLPDENSLPLPPPLDHLVGDRYSAILKRPLVVKDLPDVQLSDRITTWKARKAEHQDELFLLLNLDRFLADSTLTSVEAPVSGESPSIDKPDAPSSGTTTRPESKQRLVLFSPTPDTLGERPYMFGVSAGQVMEVCRPLPMVPVPGASHAVDGIVNWRGTIVPVLRMAEMVGLEGIKPSQAQRLLIALAPTGRHLVGVQVLANMRTQDLPITYTPQTLPNAETARYLHGSYELENETLVMPNLKSMLQFA